MHGLVWEKLKTDYSWNDWKGRISYGSWQAILREAHFAAVDKGA